jgi:3-oxoacyl-(acyl-carrier-protein) synthase
LRKVYVTGMGIISAIGENVAANYNSLISILPGIRKNSFGLSGLQESFPLAGIELNESQLFELAKIRMRRGYSRTALLGIIAAREALNYSRLTAENMEGVGIISGTSVGGMDKTEIYYSEMQNDRNNSIYLTSHDCGDLTEKIAQALKINGYLSTISTACSSSANAILMGAKLIKHKKLEKVIVGGSDSLTSFTVNGFNSLMILSKNECKPFDEHRDGINLVEGAAYLVLESEGSVIYRGGKILCELLGFGNACDAFHQTAMSADGAGPYLSMQQALGSSQLVPEQIDYINAHGTGTPNNDLSELTAVKRIFKDKVPPFSSTKQFTGHCLGASGGIEAVFSILSILKNMVLPNLNFSTPMKEINLSPVTEISFEMPVRNVLSNSFGFGGNNTSLIFSKRVEY